MKSIISERYQLPTFEEVVSKMGKPTIFSTLDSNKGFYQIKLHEESQLLTTFNAGKYGGWCYKRLPFGICSAPEVFQKTFTEIFGDLPGVQVYIDDILVHANNEEEHLQRLNAVFERAKAVNVR